MKKITMFLVILLAVSMLFTGCGSEDSSAAQAAAPSSGGEDFYAVSLGWMENPSGQRQKQTFEAKFAEHGIDNYSIVDANYDANRQSQQIEAFIAQGPKALFLTASDPIGIADAVAKAADAGIRVYSSDALISGANVVSTAMFDNYAGGEATMRFLADTLIEKYPTGEIVIGMITLPSNDAWAMREYGADRVLGEEKYERITVKYEWPWDSTGAVTPTATISSWMAADTNNEIKGIWCAWDGAAFEGLTVTAESRPEIIYTGSDGGEQCYNMMNEYPEQFIATAGESVYAMPDMLVEYAMTVEAGGGVPRLAIVPGYLITSTMILDVFAIKDVTTTINGQTLTAWDLVLNYDIPGYVDALNDLLIANGSDNIWIADI